MIEEPAYEEDMQTNFCWSFGVGVIRPGVAPDGGRED
jgi:hypothetical protein